jgi:hypothetical protein
MKALIALALVFAPSFARADFGVDCQVLEAEVIGKVKAVAASGSSCKLDVELTFAQPSVLCPLGVSEGETVSFVLGGACPKSDSEVSGVLQQTPGKDGYRLDY